MSKTVLHAMRWAAFAGCVSAPHVLPVEYHWPAALAAVAIAAAFDSGVPWEGM